MINSFRIQSTTDLGISGQYSAATTPFIHDAMAFKKHYPRNKNKNTAIHLYIRADSRPIYLHYEKKVR